LLNEIVRKRQATTDCRLEESHLGRMRLPEGHSDMANNNPPNLNVDELTAYASAKVKAGVPSQAVKEELERMLREDGRSEEETHSVIAEINRRTDVVGGKGSPRQSSPPKNNQEALMAQMLSLMNAMATRLDRLELQRTPAESPSVTPTPAPAPAALPTAPAPPAASYERAPRRIPDPERFDGTPERYQVWKFNCEGKLDYDGVLFPTEDAKKRYVLSCTTDKASQTLLPWILENRDSPMSALWEYMDSQFQDVHQRQRALNKLRHLRQGKRSVREYVSEFNRLRVESGQQFDTAVLREMFREGLGEELQRNLLHIPKNYSFKEYTDGVVETADDLYRIRLSSKARSHTSYSTQSRPTLNDDRDNAMDWEPSKVNRAREAKSKSKRPPLSCYSCGEPGHIARYCPNTTRAKKATPTDGKQKPQKIEELSDSDSGKEEL
jgi:hypothetical protein